MRIISGLFDTRGDAETAVDALRAADIPSDDISVITRGESGAGGVAEGAGVGAALGGAGGLLAGLGALAIPGIGPFIGAGWLATALIGAAAGGVVGGLLGSLTDAGVDESDAHVYAEGIRRGGTLVSVRVDELKEDAAASILRQAGSVDVKDRRSEYEAGGWTGYDEGADLWNAEVSGRPIVPSTPR